MDAIWLAAVAAAAWGAADYFGGASRGQTPVFVIVAVSELLGLCLVIPVLVAHGVPPPTSPRLFLAAVAGAGVTIELGLIYLALSRGEGFITAPVSAFSSGSSMPVQAWMCRWRCRAIASQLLRSTAIPFRPRQPSTCSHLMWQNAST